MGCEISPEGMINRQKTERNDEYGERGVCEKDGKVAYPREPLALIAGEAATREVIREVKAKE